MNQLKIFKFNMQGKFYKKLPFKNVGAEKMQFTLF